MTQTEKGLTTESPTDSPVNKQNLAQMLLRMSVAVAFRLVGTEDLGGRFLKIPASKTPPRLTERAHTGTGEQEPRLCINSQIIVKQLVSWPADL